MVSANVRNSANRVNSVLQERNVQGLALVAFSAAGGVVVAQEVADRILPALINTRNPSGLRGFGISALVKAGVALAFGIVATNLSGLGLVAAAYMAVGALAGAGADLLNAIQRSSLAAEAPSARAYQTQSSTSTSTSTSASPQPRQSATDSQASVSV